MSDGHLSARTTAHRKHVCRRPTVAPTTLRCERHGIYALQPQSDSRVWVYTGKRASMGAREKSLDRMRLRSRAARSVVDRVRARLARFDEGTIATRTVRRTIAIRRSRPPIESPHTFQKVDAATETRRSGGNIFSVHIHTTPRGTISVMKHSEAVCTSCPPSTSRRATDRPTARRRPDVPATDRPTDASRRRDVLSGRNCRDTRSPDLVRTRARARTHAS